MKTNSAQILKRRLKRGMLFGGEMMTCRNCGKQQRSDPKIESGWNHFTVDGSLKFYICPECFDKMIAGDGS